MMEFLVKASDIEDICVGEKDKERETEMNLFMILESTKLMQSYMINSAGRRKCTCIRCQVSS